MIKKVVIVLLFVTIMFLLCGCDNSSNHPLAMQTSNTKAYIKMNEKTIVVDVDAYQGGSNGSVIIYGTDGTNYKTHYVNVVLVKHSEGR